MASRARARRLAAMATCLGLLAAAAVHAQQLRGNLERRAIAVVVDRGAIVVPEEVANTNDRESTLTWQLTTPGFRFSGAGIAFEVRGKHSCKVSGDGRSVRCGKLDHIRGERFKYLVYVMRDNGQPLEPLDPWIVND